MATRSLIPRSTGLFARHPLSSLQETIDSLFDEFSQQMESWPSMQGGGGAYMPRINFSEEEDKYVISAELPGVGKDNVKVSTEGRNLTIQGEKSDEKEARGRSFYRRERSFGRFLRTLPIPDDGNVDQIDATFRDGVLTLEIPRSEQPEKTGKTVEIHS